MDNLTFGCNATNNKTVGSYNYYLYSRIDGYAVILREKTDDTEWLFYVIGKDEDVATVWASAETKTYKRPDEMAVSVKKYAVNKLREFKSATTRVANTWA